MNNYNSIPRDAPPSANASANLAHSVYRSLESPITGGFPLGGANTPTSFLDKSFPSTAQNLFATKPSLSPTIVQHQQPPTAEVFQPPPLPFGVSADSISSVRVKSEPIVTTVACITSAMKLLEVDATYNPSKIKWKCRAYFRNQETTFVARLYSLQNDSRCVLLLERRSGCAMYFCNLFTSLCNELSRVGLCDGSFTISQQSQQPQRVLGFRALPLPDDFLVNKDEDDKDAVDTLLPQCFAAYVDVQIEGLRVLANHVSDNPHFAKYLLPVIDRLVQLVEPGQDRVVRRLACSTLANISNEAANAIVENHGLPPLSQAVVNENECCELRRHAAKVLYNICPKFAQQVQGCFGPGLLESIVRTTTDERLKQQLVGLLNKI